MRAGTGISVAQSASFAVERQLGINHRCSTGTKDTIVRTVLLPFCNCCYRRIHRQGPHPHARRHTHAHAHAFSHAYTHTHAHALFIACRSTLLRLSVSPRPHSLSSPPILGEIVSFARLNSASVRTAPPQGGGAGRSRSAPPGRGCGILFTASLGSGRFPLTATFKALLCLLQGGRAKQSAGSLSCLYPVGTALKILLCGSGAKPSDPPLSDPALYFHCAVGAVNQGLGPGWPWRIDRKGVTRRAQNHF